MLINATYSQNLFVKVSTGNVGERLTLMINLSYHFLVKVKTQVNYKFE